nr:MAG TPA: hypothetical protein [Crassvirales sp.]
MSSLGGYPIGAEHDSSAPYNQKDTSVKEFDVVISQTLSKSTTVYTNDYKDEVDEDEEGKRLVTNTSDTNWLEAYKENHLTLPNLLKNVREILKDNLRKSKWDEKKNLKFYIDELSNWVEDEIEVVKD